MKILIIEPFFTGSHKSWAEGYQTHSSHEVFMLSQKGRHWKWRMFGGAVTLAKAFLKNDFLPDCIVASDMLDVATFKALAISLEPSTTRKNQIQNIPITLYFHENQICYPWSPTDQDIKLSRNNQYGFINYTSALTADAVFFNSDFHRKAFIKALPDFLKQFPDDRELENVSILESKSKTLSLGMDLKRFLVYESSSNNEVPVLLWNHRWEYDKNPNGFFNALFRLKEEQVKFKLIVLGQAYQKAPPIFAKAKELLKDETIHFGYAKDFATYAKLLWQADILPVTSYQDFFGGSVVEAIFCNCFPILPNRLAYLEHIPEDRKAEIFYDNDELFYPMLKQKILGFEKLNFIPYLQNFVAPYDWSTLAHRYDENLEVLLENPHQ